MRIVLASASPRRAQLLKQICARFEVLPSHIEERRHADETPSAYVQRLALDKARYVAGQLDDTALVIGSDTLIDHMGEVMEKPLDRQHFKQMLGQLAGHVHQVRTAVAVVVTDGQQIKHEQVVEVVTDVELGAINDQQLGHYWNTGEPQDKAGGYAIQGGAARFVKRINGSYTAIVGLPLYETDQLLSAVANS